MPHFYLTVNFVKLHQKFPLALWGSSHLSLWWRRNSSLPSWGKNLSLIWKQMYLPNTLLNVNKKFPSSSILGHHLLTKFTLPDGCWMGNIMHFKSTEVSSECSLQFYFCGWFFEGVHIVLSLNHVYILRLWQTFFLKKSINKNNYVANISFNIIFFECILPQHIF